MWGGFAMVNFAHVRRLSLPTGGVPWVASSRVVYESGLIRVTGVS